MRFGSFDFIKRIKKDKPKKYKCIQSYVSNDGVTTWALKGKKYKVRFKLGGAVIKTQTGELFLSTEIFPKYFAEK